MSYDQKKIDEDLKKESSDFQTKVISELETYLRTSSSKMSPYWDKWDLAQANFKGYRTTDPEDRKALANGEPTKIIVPVTYAQVQTATSYLYSIFTQKARIFEYSFSGDNSAEKKEAIETDINYQAVKTKLLLRLFLWLYDINKYGVGIMKISWEEQKQMMRIGRKIDTSSIFSTISSLITGKQSNSTTYEEEVAEVTKYEGNKVQNISPYCFFPDPTIPYARFQEGAFVAHEEIVSKSFMRSKESTNFFGTKHVKPFSDGLRGISEPRRRWFDREFAQSDIAAGKSKVDNASVVLTEVQFTITPKEWGEAVSSLLGDEDTPQKFVAVIANDKKLIKFEKLDYLHGDYTYVVAEYNPDHNAFLSSGLPETIQELQDIITWLLNSHMTNVRKLIKNQVIADTSKIHIEDLENGNTVVRAKGSPTADISKSIHEFSVTDATQGHISSMENMMRMVQLVTGVNENALGAYAPGRRSAFESKQVNAGAALRLKTQALLIWSNGLEPAGQQILSNTLQTRSKETYEKIVGDLALKAPFEETILVDPELLAGGYSLLPYDGTLPSEKDEVANYLTQLFTSIASNPQLAQGLNLSPQKLLEGIAELKGIKNLKDFQISQEMLAQSGNPAMNPLSGGVQAQVLPDAEVQAQLAAGKIEPIPSSMNPLEAIANGIQ